MDNFMLFLYTIIAWIWGRGTAEEIGDLFRRKRHLLFPDPGASETKVQVLFALGLPMEGEVSMTLGYILKCNYELPYNATVFTEGWESFAGGDDSRKKRQTSNKDYSFEGSLASPRITTLLVHLSAILGLGH